jgi:predicted dehydrogenase
MNHTSRRSFIKSAGLATGALGFNILHAQNKGDKLRLAFIAAGGKAGAQVNTAKTAGDICTCFAEIDKNSWGGVLGTWKDAKGYQDYRQLFDKEKDYDAIVVTTPDHQHYMPTALGLMAGKACYTQKPLVHTVWEARQLLEGTRKYKVATQMGNQGHANNGNRRIYEFVNGGLLGDVTEIHCFSNRPIWPQGGPRPAGEDSVPDNIDWDLWIGPAPMRPFKKDVYHPFKWRGFYDFGGGALADMACHTNVGLISDGRGIYFGSDATHARSSGMRPRSERRLFSPAGARCIGCGYRDTWTWWFRRAGWWHR